MGIQLNQKLIIKFNNNIYFQKIKINLIFILFPTLIMIKIINIGNNRLVSIIIWCKNIL